METGELRGDLDLEVAMDILYGPIYYRLLVGHAPLEDEFVEVLTEHVMNGLSALGYSPDGKAEKLLDS